MDVQQKLDEIVATVDGARSMPMSASCVVNRAELLAMLEDVRLALPGSLAQAQELLGGREQMVAEAQQEAQRIIDSAQAERGSMVSGTEIARSAQEEADRILTEARREAEEIRAEADDYVDSKLANFEVVLSKTVGSVERGREKLLGSGPGADEYGEQYAEDAPERTADPDELRHRADDYVDARLGSVAAVLTKTLEAVGRGRQKLLGHRPEDDLGVHMAAQDAAGGQFTSDADYMAGLAAADPAAAAPVPQQYQPRHESPHEPQEMQPVLHAGLPQQVPVNGTDPYYGGQPLYAQQPADPYHAQQQAYAQQLQAQQAQADAQAQQDAYYAQQPQHGYGQPYYGQPQQFQQPPDRPAALDETSLFDTSLIDLEQVRQYEQGYGQDDGQGYPQGG